jgi:putative DNA primase/helicase
MNPQITPAMLATLEKLVEQHRNDTPADQEALCVKVGQDEPEIGVKLREMFKAAKLTDLSALAKVKPASFILPEDRNKYLDRPKEPEPSGSGLAGERRRREARMAARKAEAALSPKIEEPAKPQAKGDEAKPGLSLTKLICGLGAQKREELFKTLIADKTIDDDRAAESEKPEREAEAQSKKKAFGIVLDPDNPMTTARLYLGKSCWNEKASLGMLQFWQKQFWEWNGKHWKVLDDDTLRSRLYVFLEKAKKEPKKGWHPDFSPTNTDVNKVVDALGAVVNLEPENEMPGWLGSGVPVENVRELISMENGLLYPPERRLLEHTPRFWSSNALEFKYDPDAKAPRFEQFLKEVWPGDEEAQQSLVEMIGLCLTDVTKYQKAFMFVGPKRGGRGTIGRLIKGLIGKENYIGVTLHSFSDTFGMQSFIGKKVAVFSDARLDGVRQQSLSVIAERLLSITGEDVQDINRKYVGYWSGALSTRVIIFSNELLRFQDDSGALASRFITNRMIETFWGREDLELTTKLLAERSGILNLALDALDRLRSRGRLIQPSSGLEMSENLTRLTSDVLAFVEECCVIDCEASVTVDKLFSQWEIWCGSRKVRHGWGKNQFSEKIRAACPTVTSSRPRVNNPGRLTTLIGLGLTPKPPKLTLAKVGT